MTADRKRCVIIGSGLGGLSCGVMLARNGYNVTVLEKAARPGGCLQCFSRGGAKFETGMHFIGSAAPGQTLYRLMRYLGMQDVRLSRLDSTGYDIAVFGADRYRFANGREPFIEQLSACFPHERDNIVRYHSLIESIAQASSLHTLRYAVNDAAVNTHYQTVSVNSVIDSITSDRRLRDVLASNLMLYAGRRDRTPFSQHAFITDFYNRSAYRVEGGSDAISQSLVGTIANLGGEVRTGCGATRIVCDGHRATGVVTADENFVPADMVIAAIHPARMTELLDGHMVRPAYIRRMAALPSTPGAFMAYLRFKPGRMPYLNSNFHCFRNGSPWGCEEYDDTSWPKGYLYMHLCDSDGQTHARSGVLLTYMDIAELSPWAGTVRGRRGNSYEEFKRLRAERLLDAAEHDFPGLRDSVEEYYTSTPLTNLDYTGTPDGSMYGVAKDITLGAACRVTHKTRIPNLLLAGQNINCHGMLGVLVGSIVTCSELIGAERLYRQIVEANE